MGTPQFAVPALKMLSASLFKPLLVVTQPDRPKGRKRKLHSPQVKIAAEELSIPVFQPEDINLEQNIKTIEDIKPDIIITVAYGGYLRRKIRKLPALGCINLHPSLLPLYRGAAPINYALFNGDKKTGISIFKIIAKMDAGALLWKREIKIANNDNYTSLSDKLAQEGAKDLLLVLNKLNQNSIKYVKQDDSQASYSSKLTRNDLLIEWNCKAEFIYNKVRGLAEYPGAVAGFREKRIKLIEIEILEKSTAEAGIITDVIKNSGIVVATGSKDILIKKLQPEGKKIMTSQAFCLGARIETGEKFTDGF